MVRVGLVVPHHVDQYHRGSIDYEFTLCTHQTYRSRPHMSVADDEEKLGSHTQPKEQEDADMEDVDRVDTISGRFTSALSLSARKNIAQR